ncbi:hypothetical protein SSX86_031211, partial [Deinandra increscens subsp. villosa]
MFHQDQEFQLDTKIEVMKIYTLNGYRCAPAPTYNKVALHSASLDVDQSLVAEPMPEDAAYPGMYFNFFPYEQLRIRLLKNQILTGTHTKTTALHCVNRLTRLTTLTFSSADYIGRVDDLEHVDTGNNNSVLRMTVTDTRGNTVIVALWKEIHTTLDMAAITGADHAVIVAFTALKVVPHRGEPQLQSTGGTKVEIDPHLTIAQDLANWFNQAEMGGTENRSPVPKLRIAEKMSEKDRVTISHLRQQDNRTLKEGVYTIEATITSFTEGRLWFYVTCTACNSRVYMNMTYSCEKHKQQHLRYSYSVNCDIEDHTGTANVTIFDKGMLAMLETNCYNMYTDNSDAGSKTLPPPIEAQRSAKWIFQLKNGERFNNDSIKFMVNNVFQAAAPTPLALTTAGTSGESKLCITEGDKKPVRRQLFVDGETDVEGKQQISADVEQENTGKMKALLEKALGKQPAAVPGEQTMSPKRKAPVKQDYIGKVTDLEEKQIGDRSPVLMMTLQEPGARAVVMKLSESIYTEINLENITTMDREVIVAATALKVVPAPGSLGLLCTPTTTVSVNPGIPIARNMAKEFRAQRNDAPIERLAVRAVYQPYQDRTTFATYISSFYRGHRSLREGDSYTLAAMITAISETEPWFYGSCIACPSASRVQHTGVVFSCQEHGDKYVYYSYKAVCTVRDETGTAIVTVLDQAIPDMIGVEGCQMINVKESTDTRVLPHPIIALI